MSNSIASFLLSAALVGLASPAVAAERGTITGGVVHEIPGYFKESFLEIAEDVDEATEADRHVLLFFQLNACPYCDRMLEESFETEPLESYIRAHFDAIALNVAGDREVAFNDEVSATEKELADLLDVRATPAILFLDSDNQTVVRVNGYRAPERFQAILEYVATRSYRSVKLSDYLRARLERDVYVLRDNPLFDDVTDLSAVPGPLLVILEDGSCFDCNEFHDGVLAHPLVQQELEPFTVVRLDADSSAPVIAPDGEKTTMAGLADRYEMIYRPGTLVFDDGRLIRRTDSLVFPHHFKEGLRYVGGGHYKTQPDYATYSEQRTEELLSQGVDIDLGRPRAAD